MRSPLRLAVVAAVTAVVLTGCTISDVPEAVPTASATASPTPTPEATPVAVAPETCDDLVDDETEAEFVETGYELTADYEQRAAAEGWPTLAFVTYGGLLCQWGYPASDASTIYGYSPITPDQAGSEKARLLASGFTTRDALGGELYELVHEYGIDHYLFTDGFWYHTTVGEDALAEMLAAVEA
jgi:hypothetical protein